MPKNAKKAARRRKTQGIEGTDLDASTKEIDVVSKIQLHFFTLNGNHVHVLNLLIAFRYLFFFFIAIGYIHNFK